MDIAKVGFEVKTDQLKKGRVELKKFSTDTGKAEKSTDRLSRAQKLNVAASQRMANAIKVAAAAAAAFAAVASAGVIARLTSDGLEHIDMQAKLARSMGATTDALRAVQIAASDSGIDGLDGSLNRLNRRLGAAMMGNKEYSRSIAALGLNLSELSRMDADERIAAIADAVRDSGMTSQETARHLQMLGFQQSNANAFFRQGGDAVRAARAEVKAYGLSISEVDAAMVEKANDQWSRLAFITESAKNKLAVEMAPVLMTISKLLTEAAKEGDGFGSSIETGVEKGVRGVSFMINAGDGLVRTFELAGKSISLIFLHLQASALWFAEGIVNGPVRAINNLIDTANKIPGIDIGGVGLTGLGAEINQEYSMISQAIEEGKADIQAALLKPLAGSDLLAEYRKVKEEAQKAAGESTTGGASSTGGVSADSGLAGLTNATKATETAMSSFSAALKQAREAVNAGPKLTAENVQYNDLTRLTAEARTASVGGDNEKALRLAEEGVKAAMLLKESGKESGLVISGALKKLESIAEKAIEPASKDTSEQKPVKGELTIEIRGNTYTTSGSGDEIKDFVVKAVEDALTFEAASVGA